MIERRTFLKLGAALGITHFAEPVIARLDPPTDWIVDKGDYILIRVPDHKVFGSEIIDKPAIVWLGSYSVMRDVKFGSFVNIASAGPALISDSSFNSSTSVADTWRPCVLVSGKGLTITRNEFVSGPPRYGSYCPDYPLIIGGVGVL